MFDMNCVFCINDLFVPKFPESVVPCNIDIATKCFTREAHHTDNNLIINGLTVKGSDTIIPEENQQLNNHFTEHGAVFIISGTIKSTQKLRGERVVDQVRMESQMISAGIGDDQKMTDDVGEFDIDTVTKQNVVNQSSADDKLSLSFLFSELLNRYCVNDGLLLGSISA